MNQNDHNDNTRTHVVLTQGTMVSHYRIVEKIGAGGMGEVYLAVDTKLKRKVALKFLPSNLATNENARARFTREAQAVAALKHPNIVTIYEVDEFSGRPYFAMEHVEGKSLRDVIAGEKLNLDTVIDLAKQILDGLDKAHQAGIIHRDIKPANIVIDADGRPKILDFGLATVQGSEKITKTGSTLGTVRYMSPEQARGEKVDHRSDLFSFGSVLYEMITGKAPFKGEHDAEEMYNVINETPDPLSRFKAGVPYELQQIIDKALDKNSETRYQTASGFLSDLRRLRQSSSDGLETIAGVRAGKRFNQSAALIALFAVVVAVAGYFVTNRTQLGQELGLAQDGDARWTNSIAVLPFRDFSKNKDQEYFCNGMTDAVIGKLSGIENLKVISLTSVLRYRDSDKDLKTIGRELGVNTILEASFQREGDAIRLQAQLINVADDDHLWAQTYNRELENVFEIQDDISRAIVDAMRIQLFGEDTTAISRRHTENVEAFNYYSRGRHLWNKRTESDLKKSIEYFERAIELDSGYALAWAGLADAWAILPGYSDALDSETLPKARKAAETALQIDQNLAEAHASLGLILWSEADLQGAEREFQRSIELNAGYHWAHFWYSKVLGRLGRFREQTEQEKLAFELNPMSIPLIAKRATRKKATFEFREAEEMYQRLIEIEPSRWPSYVGYADLLAIANRKEEAVKQCLLAVQIDKQAYNDIAYIYDRIGDFEGALWAADKNIEFSPDNPNSHDTRGYIYALYGQLDSAIASYEKALDLNPNFTPSIVNLGAAFVFLREYEKAESLYQALASDPDKNTRALGRLQLTTILEHQGKFKEAYRMWNETEALAVSDSLSIHRQLAGHWSKVAYYLDISDEVELAQAELEYIVDKLSETEANDWLVVNARGLIAICHARMGDLETANKLMKELGVELDKYNFYAVSTYWTAIAGLESIKRNYDLSLKYSERAARTSNGFTMWFTYGLDNFEAGRLNEAIEIFERLIDRYDGSRSRWTLYGVLNHFRLAIAYEMVERHDEAIKQYETFLDIWKNADSGIPSIEDAKERLAKLRNKS